MNTTIPIDFECLPLRSIGRLDVPLDATEEFAARCERIKQARSTHGTHNSYYLLDGLCTYQLTNNPQVGMLRFAFEGTVLTDAADLHVRQVDLHVSLAAETCEWLTKDASEWFYEAVRHAVSVEFDRFIADGDLDKAKQRLAQIQQASNDSGGFLGMDV